MIENHDKFMARAIALSRRGFPAPNPRVGCVIVKSGQIIGEGYHHHAGALHAETVALKNTKVSPTGASVYVTLEPCNHVGRTPPCSEALIAAGVSHVYVAVEDPNPIAKGGLARLREAGIGTIVGVGATRVEEVNWIYLTAIRRGRPVVCVKAATTIDGFMAAKDGQSKWITGSKSRTAGHRLRAEFGAVLVGRGTVEADDPQLTARIPGIVNQPVRIVLDPKARLSGSELLFQTGGKTICCVSEGYQNRSDHEVVNGKPSFDLRDLLAMLQKVGLIGVLVEGGPKTIRSFFDAGLVDTLELFIAPRFLGSGLRFEGPTNGLNDLELQRTKRHDLDLQMTFSVPTELVLPRTRL